MAKCNDSSSKQPAGKKDKPTQPIRKPRPETKSEAIERLQGN